MTILDLTETERQDIYVACRIIESVLEKHGEIYLDSFFNDNRHNSIVHLIYSNNRMIKDRGTPKNGEVPFIDK